MDSKKTSSKISTESLAHYEAVIGRNLQPTEEMADALLQIHDRRLYRESYHSFQDYLTKRWNISRSRGYQLVKYAKLRSAGDKPLNERQIRDLTTQGKRPTVSPTWKISRVVDYVRRSFQQQPESERRELIVQLRKVIVQLERELPIPTTSGPPAKIKFPMLPPNIDPANLVIEHELPPPDRTSAGSCR